ncbi:14367_t:CDS:2, partial [Dentiscutata erythropus]
FRRSCQKPKTVRRVASQRYKPEDPSDISQGAKRKNTKFFVCSRDVKKMSTLLRILVKEPGYLTVNHARDAAIAWFRLVFPSLDTQYHGKEQRVRNMKLGASSTICTVSIINESQPLM